ncbi:MAG TPA: MFS transporter, partial [Thermomicrobiales bacterium]|nr:MFS transporter [Thermomicrobiales bacterium]
MATTPTPTLTPEPVGIRSVTKLQWKMLGASWIGYFLDGFDFVIITLVLSDVSTQFHLNLVQAASLVSAAFVPRWLGGLLLGAIGDRWGRKPAMILSILCYSLGTLLCGLSWDYWSLFAFRALVGLGMAGEYGAGSTYVMESWPKRMRNAATGIWLSSYPIGTMLTALLFRLVVPTWGWRWMFIIGIVPVVAALVIRRTMPEATEWTLRVGAAKVITTVELLFSPKRRVVNIVTCLVILACLVLIFSNSSGAFTLPLGLVAAAGFVSFIVQLVGKLWPMMIALVFTIFFLYISNYPIASLLPTYLKGVGYDPGQIATAVTWSALGWVVGSITWGFIADTRLGTRGTYVIAMIL